MTPSPTLLGRSAYSVLGGLSYLAAITIATVLAIAWQLTLGERLVVVLAPPLAFIAIATIATAFKGREWIVFFQTAAGAIATTMIAGLAIGANLPRLADIVVIGIGTFLVFGRIGCFRSLAAAAARRAAACPMTSVTSGEDPNLRIAQAPYSSRARAKAPRGNTRGLTFLP